MGMKELWFGNEDGINGLQLCIEEENGVTSYFFLFYLGGKSILSSKNVVDRKQLKDLFNVIGNEIGAFPDLARIEKKGRFEALMEAQEKWRGGDWANAPRRKNPIEERIANGQFVTDWLKERAELELE